MQGDYWSQFVLAWAVTSKVGMTCSRDRGSSLLPYSPAVCTVGINSRCYNPCWIVCLGVFSTQGLFVLKVIYLLFSAASQSIPILSTWALQGWNLIYHVLVFLLWTLKSLCQQMQSGIHAVVMGDHEIGSLDLIRKHLMPASAMQHRTLSDIRSKTGHTL